MNFSKNVENFSQHWFTSNGHTLGVGIETPTESYFPNVVEISTITAPNTSTPSNIILTTTMRSMTSIAATATSTTTTVSPTSTTVASVTATPTQGTSTTLKPITLSKLDAMPTKRKIVRKNLRKRPFRTRKLASVPQSNAKKIQNKYNIDYDTDTILEKEYEIIHKTE